MIERSKQSAKVSLILMALCLSAVAQQRQTITGKVTRIVDGDTFEMEAEGRSHTIRFDGADAPEKGQAYGKEAAATLEALALGKIVTAAIYKEDRNTPGVARVTLRGDNLGVMLVDRGAAWYSRRLKNELSLEDQRAYERAEVNAKAARRGLWSDPSPIPPWDYRGTQVGNRSPTVTLEARPQSTIIGNRNSMIYHRPDCPDYNKVAEGDRVLFRSEADAEAAGYRRAGNCPK
jgi:endonuclease YncB( thermonuclease family)